MMLLGWHVWWLISKSLRYLPLLKLLSNFAWAFLGTWQNILWIGCVTIISSGPLYCCHFMWCLVVLFSLKINLVNNAQKSPARETSTRSEACVQSPVLATTSALHVWLPPSASSLPTWMRGGKPRREIQSNLFPARGPRRKEKQSPKLQEKNTLLATLRTMAPHSHWHREYGQALNAWLLSSLAIV